MVLIGVYKVRNGVEYYAISKAFDEFGHTKLEYLRNVLIVVFILISVIIIFVSIYISKTIANPITELESKINNYKIEKENNPPIHIATTTIELNNLTTRFNELLAHTTEVFKFQKHTINHISHQLKTPIAVLVSELEKVQNESSEPEIKHRLTQQIIQAKSLGEIINVLLEISKIEAGQTIEMSSKRVDELIFDSIGELNIIYPEFNFNINYSPNDMQEKYLLMNMNSTLLKQAMQNLLSNSIIYSNSNQADILFHAENQKLKINFSNHGIPISEAEEKLLFKHFFRGKNSKGKTGHGLGLMLTKRILEIHDMEILYLREDGKNVFEIRCI